MSSDPGLWQSGWIWSSRVADSRWSLARTARSRAGAFSNRRLAGHRLRGPVLRRGLVTCHIHCLPVRLRAHASAPHRLLLRPALEPAGPGVTAHGGWSCRSHPGCAPWPGPTDNRQAPIATYAWQPWTLSRLGPWAWHRLPATASATERRHHATAPQQSPRARIYRLDSAFIYRERPPWCRAITDILRAWSHICLLLQ